ncbi:FHA domain-containing protein [Mycoplasmatota bacterium WC44]
MAKFVLKSIRDKKKFKIKGAIKIGRTHESNIFNYSPISREHGEFILRNKKLFVKDLNSTNGTLLNGQKCIPFDEVEVKKNDILDIGSIEYKIKKSLF